MAFQDPFANPQAYSQSQSSVGFDAGLRSYMLRIYNYMASALALTGIVALLALLSARNAQPGTWRAHLRVSDALN